MDKTGETPAAALEENGWYQRRDEMEIDKIRNLSDGELQQQERRLPSSFSASASRPSWGRPRA